MSSVFKPAVVSALAVAGLGFAPPWTAAADADSDVLRVCADPNNLPFSNRRGEGFENALAELVADELGLGGVAYTWWPQRRGFIRNTLRAGRCDIVMGVPAGFELAKTTRPYYRSTYVFVTRTESELRIDGFDDPRLPNLRIGLHVIGDDYSNVPPARALAARGMVENIRGYTVYGDYSRPNPPRNLIDAVAAGDVDVAVAWGPLAGYFAGLGPEAMTLTPVTTETDPASPMIFDISMAVRRDDGKLKAALDEILERRHRDIRKLLARYGVPLLHAQRPKLASGEE